MAITVSAITGGAAFAVYKTFNIQFGDDSKVDLIGEWSDVQSALRGKFDKIQADLLVKCSGTPLYYDTAQLAAMFPYIGGAGVIGNIYGGSNDTLKWNSNNSDQIILSNSVITKMPDIHLGVDKIALGPMEFTGIIASGDETTNAAAYFSWNPAGGAYTYAAPALPGTALLGRFEFTGVWGAVTGFGAVQGQEGWQISHELDLRPVKFNARTRAYRLAGYRAGAKCMPYGPTILQLMTNLYLQGAGVIGGQQLSAGGNTLTIAPINGAASPTIVIGAAAPLSLGMVFGNILLRAGEVGWVSSDAVSANTVPLTLS